jgi:cell wall-associated NlpC family hydrolase
MTDTIEVTPSIDELQHLVEIAAEQERRARFRGLVLTVVPLVVGAAWLAISVTQVRTLMHRADVLAISNEKITTELQQSHATVERLEARVNELKTTEAQVLQFIGDVTSAANIRLVDPSVDWEATKEAILSMPAGTRKGAVLGAILLAWKDLPFSTKNRDLSSGLDSPHFIDVILRQFGVQVRTAPGQRLSEAMMSAFEKVDRPLPGDLLFYRGNVGNFVVMYLAPGSPAGNGVAIGTLQTGEEIQVIDTTNINTRAYPFVGAFRVSYPATMPVRKTEPLAVPDDDEPPASTERECCEKG